MRWDEDDEDDFYATIDRRPRTGLIVGTAAATSIAVLALLYVLVPLRAPHSVPALVGLPLEQAVLAARKVGLRLVVSGSAPDGLVDRGAVARQDPLAGSAALSGGRIAVVLSDGPASRPAPAVAPPAAVAPSGTVVVPRLVGLPLASARQALARAGLRAGRIRHDADEDRADGAVISHTPAAGARVAPGSVVELVINETDAL